MCASVRLLVNPCIHLSLSLSLSLFTHTPLTTQNVTVGKDENETRLFTDLDGFALRAEFAKSDFEADAEVSEPGVYSVSLLGEL